jgi:DNA-binding transcriptional LysR family regulator
MRLTLRQLQVFVAIADHGTTTAAGQAVALSQSASSAALQELEAHFGTPLFDRIGRRLALNGHGRALLEPARTLLVNAADLERQPPAATIAGAPLRLVLAASTTIGNYLLPPRIAELLRQAPQAEVDLRIDNSAGVVAAVQRLDVDAGLIEGPCHERGLQVTAWQQDPLVIVAAADAPARWSLDELRRARWLLREPGSGTREAVEQALLPHLRGFAQTLQLGNTEAIKQAAIAGLGLACLSRHALEEPLALGRLRVLETRCRPAAHPVAGTPPRQAMAAGVAGVAGGGGVAIRFPVDSSHRPSVAPIHAWRGSTVSTKVDTHQSRMPFRQIAGICRRRDGSTGVAAWMPRPSPHGRVGVPRNRTHPAIPQETSF